MPVTNAAVFCGSKDGHNPLYRKHTTDVGTLLASLGIGLVYGGGSVGLMGAVADSVMTAGGRVTGVIPQVLLAWEQQHRGITDLIVVPDMHERKRMMYELSDAAIILPGGFGTLDEFFEMLTWNTLSIHDKHICLLNTDGFYDHLLGHIRRMEEEGFLYESTLRQVHFVNTPEDLAPLLQQPAGQ